MKKAIMRLFALPALITLFAGSAYAMEDSVFVSGREWSRQMSAKEKMMSLLPPMALYHKFGVRFQKTVFEYVDSLDSELAENPLMEDQDVANIFASTVYKTEPENRLSLERMSAVFEILKKRDPENAYPSIPLSQESILAE